MVEATGGSSSDAVSAERQRVMDLVQPLVVDKMAWEASFTAEEKKKGDDFEQELRTDQAKMQSFLMEIHNGFAEADADGNGLLSKSEFMSFVSIMNNNGVARGLKHRDTT